MARLLRNSLYVMIPRTGCQTAEKILFEQNLIIETIRGKSRFWHPDVKELKELGYWDRVDFKFTFVRHPLDWLRSRWAYRKQEGIKPAHLSKNVGYVEPFVPLIDESETFNEFIEIYISVCKNNIGLLTLFFNEYTEDVTFIGKLELLKNNLIYVLQETNEKFNALILCKSPQINQAAAKKEWANKTLYTKNQAGKIMEIENKIVNKFNYKYILPEWIK